MVGRKLLTQVRLFGCIGFLYVFACHRRFFGAILAVFLWAVLGISTVGMYLGSDWAVSVRWFANGWAGVLGRLCGEDGVLSGN